MRPAACLLMALLLPGCASAGTPASDSAQAAAPATPPATGAPTAKEAVALVFRNADVRLDSSSTCSGVGTAPDDVTIGDFLAGFLAEQTGQGGKNWIDATCKDAPSGLASPGWECQVMIRRVDGEERWGWGVRFFVRATDRKADRSTFRCIGAG